MRDLLWRVHFRRKPRLRRVTSDAAYGTAENIVALEDPGIRAYLPLPDWGVRRPTFVGQDDLVHGTAADAYRCPAGHLLGRAKAKREQEVVVYWGNPATCNACPLKTACTESDRGRTVRRSFHAEYLDRVRCYHQTPDYQEAMRKLKVWVEPPFAGAEGRRGWVASGCGG